MPRRWRTSLSCWHVLKVSALGKGPDWAYSLGLFHNLRHPEIAARTAISGAGSARTG